MKTKTITSRLMTILVALLAALVNAATEPAEGSDAALTKLAAEKRMAIIALNVEHAPNQFQAFLGVFISEDGLGLINLASLGRKEKPKAYADGKAKISLEAILAILPGLEMALVKFDHRPKVWLKVAEKEPEVDEHVALVPVDIRNAWKDEIAPVIGPILVKRSGTSSNLTVTRFTRILSLGSAVSPQQRAALNPGCFAINDRGELVGFMGGTQMNRSQTLIFVTPTGDLGTEIDKLVKIGTSIPFPLPPEDNLIDLALLDGNYRKMDMAMAARNQALARQHLDALMLAYPENWKLKALALTDPLLMDPAKRLGSLKNFHPDAKASKADQIAVLQARAGPFLMSGDMQGAVRELEAAIEPNLAPPDFSEHRFRLAETYTQMERFEKAEALYRQIYPFNSDSIDVLSGFQKVLYRLGEFEEADRLADREYELIKIYRRR